MISYQFVMDAKKESFGAHGKSTQGSPYQKANHRGFEYHRESFVDRTVSAEGNFI